MSHVVGMPRHLFAACEQCITKFLVASTVADVPLAAGDDLERTVAFFVELHRVRDCSWFGLQVT